MRVDVGAFLSTEEIKSAQKYRVPNGSCLTLDVTLTNIRTSCHKIGLFLWDPTSKVVVAKPVIFTLDIHTHKVEHGWILLSEYQVLIAFYDIGTDGHTKSVAFAIADGEKVRWCSELSLHEFTDYSPSDITFDFACVWQLSTLSEMVSTGITRPVAEYEYLFTTIEPELVIQSVSHLPKTHTNCELYLHICKSHEKLEEVRARSPNYCCVIERTGPVMYSCGLKGISKDELVLMSLCGAKGETFFGVLNFNQLERSKAITSEMKAVKKGANVSDVENGESVEPTLSILVRKSHGLNSIGVSNLNRQLKVSEMVLLVKAGYAHEVGEFIERDFRVNDILCLEIEKSSDIITQKELRKEFATQLELTIWGKGIREFTREQMDFLTSIAKQSERKARTVGRFLGISTKKVVPQEFHNFMSQISLASQRAVILEMFHCKSPNLPSLIAPTYQKSIVYFAGTVQLICQGECYKGSPCMPLLLALLDLPKESVPDIGEHLLAPLFSVFGNRGHINLELTEKQLQNGIEFLDFVLSTKHVPECPICEAIAALFDICDKPEKCHYFLNLAEKIKDNCLSQKLFTRLLEREPDILRKFTPEFCSPVSRIIMRHFFHGDKEFAKHLLFRWMRTEWTRCFTCDITISYLQTAFTSISTTPMTIDSVVNQILSLFDDEEPELRLVCDNFVDSLILYDQILYDIHNTECDKSTILESITKLEPYPHLHSHTLNLLNNPNQQLEIDIFVEPEEN